MLLRRALLVVAVIAAVATLTGCLSAAERDLDGIRFQARAGQDGSSGLDWIADHPVRWEMTPRNGEYTALIGPACGSVQAPVSVSDTEIIVDMNRAAIAAVACEEPVAGMDAWVHSFIGQPIDYTWDGETLLMTNDAGSLTFVVVER